MENPSSSTSGTDSSLDPKLRELIDSLRYQIRRYVVIDAVLAIVAVILSAFWLGLVLDYGPVLLGGTEMPPLARLFLLIMVAGTVLAIAAKLLVGRLRRPLPDDSLALLMERQFPKLGGRLVTSVQLKRRDRQGDSHSTRLLDRVHREAAESISEVEMGRVLTWKPIRRKAMLVAPLALCALIFLVISPNAFGRAASRLTLLSNDPWPRRAQLEMVGVELPIITATEDDALPSQLIPFEDKQIRLPKGSSGTLRIRAKAEDAEVPVVCTVYYHSDDGTKGQSNMRRIGRVVDGYQSFVLDGPPLSGLSESMTVSVRGLDDRLDDFRIEAVPPPVITQMEVAVRYPDYLREAGAPDSADMQTDYQSGLRLREGSSVELRVISNVPLGDSEVVLRRESGESEQIEWNAKDDGPPNRILIEDFRHATAIRIVPRDLDGISAQAPYRYFLGVITDEKPEVQLRLDGIGSAVTPIARLPLNVVALDDYGIETLQVTVTPLLENQLLDNESQPELAENEQKPDVDAASASVPISVDREGHGESVIDLRDSATDGRLPELKPGQTINVFAEATDAYDLGEPHQTRSEIYRLQVVTPEKLLALLERQELAMRSRLEQTLDETRNLRDTLDLLRSRGFDQAPTQTDADNTTVSDAQKADQLRAKQVERLRIQQTGLQANKTSEELTGIAESLDDLLQEMVNNRVDSADRRERIGEGVRDPLRRIVAGPLDRLKEQIKGIEASLDDGEEAARQTAHAVQTAEEVLLQLTAVLEKMLDLESYNEILDIVRQLIEDEKALLDETKIEQKKRVMDLFK
ncbi:hypothetical protein Q31b_22300 [Novipirellula aureliae]|uniref:Uncharacterized protein n=1 Tax=Novipirellula aureliae TaxID=2527966 RepID=A0A5C6E2N5_9BACT|nr:polyketide synthase [Novipirellula aureliae]TWU43192.1 hypothetical protein Q31b_22300 [Novipirellula aureliae]